MHFIFYCGGSGKTQQHTRNVGLKLNRVLNGYCTVALISDTSWEHEETGKMQRVRSSPGLGGNELS